MFTEQHRLRVEFEFVPLANFDEDVEAIKTKFNDFLQELIKIQLIDIRYGADMTIVDVTPITWRFK